MSKKTHKIENEPKLFSPKNQKKVELESDKNSLKKEQNIETKIEEDNINEEKYKNDGSGFMITELLDINQKKEENIKNVFLKEKFAEINNFSYLQQALKLGIKKTHENIRKKFIEENLTLSINQTPKEKQLYLLINEQKLSGKNSKLLKILKENKKSLSFNIGKLTLQQKKVESISIPKEDKVGCNKRDYNLKIIKTNKENLMKKLEKINEQIKEIIIKESNSEKKQKIVPDYRILDENQEEYNKHLSEIGKQSNYSSIKYRNKMKSSYDKRKKEIDLKEKELLEKKDKEFKEKMKKEKELITKRKKKNDEITNNINKHANKKSNSPEKYIYNKFKEKFEEKEKKLLDKIHLMKKEPVMRKKDFDEFEKKVKEQKKLMKIDNEERKKKLLELWLYRSQTLPSYHHPLIKYIEEEEKNKKWELNELEKKKRECNDLEKRNFKPPKVQINQELRKQIEERKKMININSIRKLRIDNKNLRIKFSPIKPNSRKNIEHQLSYNKLNDNKRNKKILNPIKKLSQKPKDYLREIISKIRKGRSPDSSEAINFSDIFQSHNNNIFQSLMTARNQIEKIDDKLKRKKMLLNINDSYANDVNLVDQVGQLLVDSVQSKINVLSKICGSK